MKFITFSLLLMFSSSVLAFPAEGDYARYVATLNGSTYEYKQSLIEYYPDRNSYLQATKLTKDGEIILETENELTPTWLYTRSKVENIFKTCSRRGGVLWFSMVGGQKFDTCTFYNEDSQLDYSLGMVPFGMVRFQEYLGQWQFLDFHLVDFKNGEEKP